MNRGTVFWARMDKLRPVIVLSPTRRNELATHVIVVPCTTRLRPLSTHVPLRRGEGGLPEACEARCEHITTLSKHELVEGPLGRELSEKRMRELERAVLLSIGVAVP